MFIDDNYVFLLNCHNRTGNAASGIPVARVLFRKSNKVYLSEYIYTIVVKGNCIY